MSVQFFITNDKVGGTVLVAPVDACRCVLTCSLPRAQPNVAGIILAGSADFKTELSQSDLFDIRRVAACVSFEIFRTTDAASVARQIASRDCQHSRRVIRG